MDYIKLLNTGKTLICNYTETQTDTRGNSWNNEVWYKYDDKYICKYINLNFTTEHNLSETKGIWIDIEKMINCNEVTIDVIDKTKSDITYDRIKNIPIGEITHIIHELDLTREFIIKQNLVKELNDYVKNNHKIAK